MARPRVILPTWLTLSLVALSTAALPSIITWLLFWYHFPARSLGELQPSFPNDEVGYWHQILTFKEAGFGGGYYTYEETPAAWSFSHFGVHGPVFPILYGLVARVVGWSSSSGPFFNMALLAVALLAAFRIGRASQWTMLGLTLLVSTSWWVLLMLPTIMQETVHHAVGIVLGALLGRLALGRGVHTGRLLATALVILGIASLMRPSWALLLTPMLLLALGPRPWLVRAIVVASTVPVLGAAWLLWRFISAPVTEGEPSWGALVVLERLISAPGTLDVGATLSALLDKPLTTIADNVQMLRTAPDVIYPGDGRFVLHLHYEAIAFCLAVGGLWLWWTLWPLLRRPVVCTVGRSADLLHLWNVGGVLLTLLVLAAPAPVTTARTVAPHLLLSLVVPFVTGSRRTLVAAIIVANVLLLGPGLEFYRIFRAPALSITRDSLEPFRQEIASSMVFDATKGSWCNTLDVTLNDYSTQLITIPGGIGITYLALGRHLVYPLKARYLLLPPGTAERFAKDTRLHHLTGNLYENLDAGCDGGSS